MKAHPRSRRLTERPYRSFCFTVRSPLPLLLLTFGHESAGQELGVLTGKQVVSTVPAQYFSAKRGLANGFMYAGSGFGGAAVSVILDALIQRLNLAWAYRILGLMTLATGIPAAWLIKERAPTRRPVSIEW